MRTKAGLVAHYRDCIVILNRKRQRLDGDDGAVSAYLRESLTKDIAQATAAMEWAQTLPDDYETAAAHAPAHHARTSRYQPRI